MSNFWYNTLTQIKGKIPEEILGSLIHSVEPCGFLDNRNPDIFTIKFKDQASLPKIDINIKSIIEKQLQKQLKRRILLEIDSTNTVTNATWLNPQFTFENFVQSTSNQMAYIACEAVALQLGKSNPLFLCAEPGMGKTHLVHALVNKAKDINTNISICYLDFNDFRDEFIESLNNKTVLEYKKRLRNHDVLIIENLENISNTKQSIQNEFFHVFNHYFENEKQLIFTSNEPSGKLKLSASIKSRLQSGIQLKILEPDPRLKQEIIHKKIKELDIELTSELNKRLNEFIPSSVRELEGILNRFYFLKQKGINFKNIDTLQSSFHELYSDSIDLIFPIESIVKHVSTVYNVTIEDLKSNSRRAEYTLPRHIGMYLAVEYSDLNKSAIARFFKKSDHTTVINAEKNIHRRIEKEKGFKQHLTKIVDNIGKNCA